MYTHIHICIYECMCMCKKIVNKFEFFYFVILINNTNLITVMKEKYFKGNFKMIKWKIRTKSNLYLKII